MARSCSRQCAAALGVLYGLASCSAQTDPPSRFAELTTAHQGAEGARRTELAAEIRDLALQLSERAASATGAERVARAAAASAAWQWIAYEQRPHPSLDQRCEALRHAAAAVRASDAMMADWLVLDAADLRMQQSRWPEAAGLLDEIEAGLGPRPSHVRVLFCVQRSKLALRDDLTAAQQHLVAAEAEADRFAEELRDRPDLAALLAQVRGWVAGQEVETWRAAGLLDRAFTALARAEAAAADSGSAVTRSKVDVLEVRLALAAHRPDRAIAASDRLLQVPDLPPERRAEHLGARAVAHAMRAATEPAALQKALDDLDALFALGVHRGTAAATWRVRQADYLARAGRIPDARAALEALDADAVAGLGARERGYLAGLRSVLLWGDAEAEARAELTAELEAAYQGFLRAWRRAPQSEAVSFLQYGEYRMLVGELVRARAAGDTRGSHAERALQVVLEVQCMSSLARRHGLEPPALAALRAELVPAHGGLLVYSFSNHRCHAFVLDRETLEAHEIPVSDIAVRRALASMARQQRLPGARARTAKAAAAVAALLLPEPVRARLRAWQEVTVVGLHEVGVVPFAELPLDQDAAVFDACAVTHLPSVPLGMLVAARQRAAGGGGVCVLTAPAVSPSLRDRFAVAAFPAEDHAAAWRTRLAPTETTVWHGAAAHHGVLDDTALARADALVVVAHGVVESEGIGLLWAPRDGHDGLVRAADLRAATSLPPLVELYSCHASAAPIRRGEFGSHDLSGALLEAGARAVLLSPQALRYQFVTDFAPRFHRALRAGKSPAQALQAVRRARPAVDLDGLHIVGLGHRRAP